MDRPWLYIIYTCKFIEILLHCGVVFPALGLFTLEKSDFNLTYAVPPHCWVREGPFLPLELSP